MILTEEKQSKPANKLYLIFILSVILFVFRVPGLSFYIFDVIWFYLIVKFIMKSKSVNSFVTISIVIFLILALINLLHGIFLYSFEVSLSNFLAAVYRYTCVLSLPFICRYFFSDLDWEFKLRFTAYISVIPLVYCIVMLKLNPELVLKFSRAISYFNDPNVFGAYISAVVIPLLVICLFNNHKKIFFIGFSLSIYNLIYIGSISYWLLSLGSFISSIFIMSFYLGKSTMNIKQLFLGFILVFLAYSTIQTLPFDYESDNRGINRTITLIKTIYEGYNISDLGSGNTRNQLMSDSLDLIESNSLIFGTGLGQSQFIMGNESGNYTQVHNSYVNLAAEMGLLGGVAFIFWLIYVLFWEFKIMKTSRVKLASSVAILSSFLISSFALPHIYMPYFYLSVIFALTLKGNRVYTYEK